MWADSSHRQRMYKTRIKAWGLDKNFKESEVVELFRLRREREKLGKPTTYRIRGREIDWDRVNSYVKRKGLDIARLLEADRSHSPTVAREITCRTPSPMSEHHQNYHHEPSASTPSLSSSAGSDHYTHNAPPFTRPMTASSTSIVAGIDPQTNSSIPYPGYTQPYSPAQPLRPPPVNLGHHSTTLPSLGHSVTIHSFQKFLTRIHETLLYEDNDKTWGTTQYWLGYSHALEWLMTIRYKAAFYRDILVQLSSDSGSPSTSMAARDTVRRFRTINRSFAMLEPVVQSVIGAKFYYFINFIHTFGLCTEVAQLPVAYPLVSIARVLLEETHNTCSAPHPPPILPGGFCDGHPGPGEIGGAYDRRRPSFSCNGVVNGGGVQLSGSRATAAAEQQEGFVSAAGHDADYYLLSHPPNVNVNNSSSGSSSSSQLSHHHHHHHSDASASASASAPASASRRLMLDSTTQDFKESAERFLKTVLEQTIRDLGVSQVPFESFLLLRETIDGRPILGRHIPFPSLSLSPMATNARRPVVVPSGVFSPYATNHHHLPPSEQEEEQQHRHPQKLLQEATIHLESAIWLLSHGNDAQAELYLSSAIATTETLLSATSTASALQPPHPNPNPQSKSTNTGGVSSEAPPFPSASLKVLLKNDSSSSSSSSSWVPKAAKVVGRCAHYHLARLYGRRIRAGGGGGGGGGEGIGTGLREKERERQHMIKSLEGTALFDEYVQWEEVEFLF